MTVSEIICKIYCNWCTFFDEDFTERFPSFNTEYCSGCLVSALLYAVELSDGALVSRNKTLEAGSGFLNMWLRNWLIDLVTN
jgi:hypothetical protein